MNNLINKVRLELLSSDPHRALRLYLMIAFVDLVVFGFFGLYFSIASLKEKNIELKRVDRLIQKIVVMHEIRFI